MLAYREANIEALALVPRLGWPGVRGIARNSQNWLQCWCLPRQSHRRGVVLQAAAEAQGTPWGPRLVCAIGGGRRILGASFSLRVCVTLAKHDNPRVSPRLRCVGSSRSRRTYACPSCTWEAIASLKTHATFLAVSGPVY